jgi:branched-chain amino acid aminotransferase
MHYLNGRWVEDKDFVLPIQDLSVMRGFGVFDFLRTYDGKPFRLHLHIDRFFNSAAFLNLTVPVSKAELEKIIRKGIELNAGSEKGIRIILSGGVSQDFISPGKSSLIIAFYDLQAPEASLYEKGVKVITTPHLRHIPHAKSLNYLTAVMVTQEAKKAGAFEAVYVDPATNEIYEATTSNIFVVESGVVKTPNEHMLKGTTRHVVIEICEELGIKVVEGPISLNDISKFDEVFLTAANKGVLGVVQVDDHIIGDGKVGKLSKLLGQAFKDVIKEELTLG